MIRVADDGPRNAKLVLIGEAPGKHEMAAGRPFVGPSGGKLAWWWRQVGLTRADFYITNVVPYQPESLGPCTNPAHAKRAKHQTRIDCIPEEEMQAHIGALRTRLTALEGSVVVIVPTGNYALYAVTGKGKVSWHNRDGRLTRPGIGDWRGSILSTRLGDRTIKVIPTIHPTAVLREPGLERRTLGDWQRIADEVGDPELNLPVRVHRIRPTIEQVEQFAAEAVACGEFLSLDIETPKGRVTEFQMIDGTWQRKVAREDRDKVARYKSGKKKGSLKMRTKKGEAYLGCIGFAYRTDESLTIPLTLDYWKRTDWLERAEAAVQRLLDSKLLKVMQNGMFDSLWLWREGYSVANWRYDTRVMHHTLDPRDDHDLAYMASVYTRQPFWKHEAKDPEEITKYASNSDALWTYNGIDTCVTLELFFVLREALESEGLMDFYEQACADLLEPLLLTAQHGIRVDHERMAFEHAELEAEAKQLAKLIESEAGMPLMAKKGLSNDRLKFVLYGAKGFTSAAQQASYTKLCATYPDAAQLNLPPVMKKNTKGERGVTVDEVAIRRLMLKHRDKLGVLGSHLLEFRRNRKKAEFLDGKAVDPDGRMRGQYSLCTDAARLAMQAMPWGTGRNLQNIDRELRYVFVPDKEEVPCGL